MSSNIDKPLQSLLVTKLEKLKNLNNEEDDTNANMAVNVEISNILLWIATNHPEVFREESEELSDISVERLYFCDSWENPDELVSTDALAILLNSGVCTELKTFCGYVNPIVLDNFNQSEPLNTVRLALGKHTNVQLLMNKLKDRRFRHYCQNDSEEEIIVHLRCHDLELKALAPLPDISEKKVFISDVTDQDATWVIQAAVALCPKTDPRLINPVDNNSEDSHPYIGELYLPRSKDTEAGVEAIAKGLLEAGLGVHTFWVSSPYIHEDKEIPGYEDISDWFHMISQKYNIEDVFCSGDEELEFIKFVDYIPSLDDLFESHRYY